MAVQVEWIGLVHLEIGMDGRNYYRLSVISVWTLEIINYST